MITGREYNEAAIARARAEGLVMTATSQRRDRHTSGLMWWVTNPTTGDMHHVDLVVPGRRQPFSALICDCTRRGGDSMACPSRALVAEYLADTQPREDRDHGNEHD